MDNKGLEKDFKKQVLKEIYIGTCFFIFGLVLALYIEYRTGYFDYFTFSLISILASLSLVNIGILSLKRYIYYKNKSC